MPQSLEVAGAYLNLITKVCTSGDVLGNVGHEMIVADFLPSPSSLQRWLTIVMDPWIILTIGVSVGIVLGALMAAICLVWRGQSGGPSFCGCPRDFTGGYDTTLSTICNR